MGKEGHRAASDEDDRALRTQSGESIDQATVWASDELEGFMRR